MYLFVILYILVASTYSLFNYLRSRKMKYYFNQYIKWINEEEDVINLHEAQPIVKKLVEQAGEGGISVPVVQPMGYGQLAQFQSSVLNAFPQRRQDFFDATHPAMQKAIGVYKYRAKNSWNPFYWIELLIFLPRNIVEFVGGINKKNSPWMRVGLVIWWIFEVVIVASLISSFSPEIRLFIKKIFNF